MTKPETQIAAIKARIISGKVKNVYAALNKIRTLEAQAKKVKWDQHLAQ